jgi:uncharacterized membrane protein YheB (UPF0754 family)
MYVWIWLMPFIAAVIGWLACRVAILLLFRPVKAKTIAGFRFQGFFPRNQHSLAQKTGNWVGRELFSVSEITVKLSGSAHFKTILPLAEQHIDHFLRVKLGEKMPVLSMFIGDKTINQLKTVFMAELEELFPVIMQQYLGGLQQELDIEKMITSKLAAYPAGDLENSLRRGMGKAFRLAQAGGAALGFVIGLLQLLILITLLMQ